MPQPIAHFFRQLSAIFRQFFIRATKLKQSLKDGTLSPEFEAMLEESLGFAEGNKTSEGKSAITSLSGSESFSIASADVLGKRGDEKVAITHGRDNYPSLNIKESLLWMNNPENGILGNFHNPDTDLFWTISGKSLSKMVRQAVKDGEPDGSHRVRIAAAYHLPELIAAAKGIEVVDHRNEANIDRLFDLFAPFEWKGEIYRLRIKGKVTKAQGNKAHSMRVDDIVAEKMPLDGKNNAPTTEVQPVNATAPNGEITIRQLFNGINPYSGKTFSISGQVDHQKISSILNGTYEATTEDHLAARSFERSIRQSPQLLKEFGGHTPKARPISNLDRKECQIGAAIGSVFKKRVGLFDTGDVVGPGGRYSSELPDQIFFNSNKKSPFHLGVGHELWHSLTVQDHRAASRIESLIAENVDNGRLDGVLRKFEGAYGDHAVQEVAANIFGTVLVDPRFWQELRTPYATEIANALKALPKNAAYDEANLIKDWTTFVKEVANLLRPKDQPPQQRSLLSDPSGTVEGIESGKPESSFSLSNEKSASKAQNSNPVAHGKTSVPDHGGKLLAPNGKPSNLSTAQWHLVRTPEFKQWFGDWEALAHSEIIKGPPIAEIDSTIAPKGDFKTLKAWAISLFRKQGGGAKNPILGFVELNENSVDDSLGHGGANKYKRAAFSIVKNVIEKGRIVKIGERGNQQSFYIAAPVRIDGMDDIVVALVFRDANTQRMYLHTVTTKENLLARGVSGTQFERPGSSEPEGITNILYRILTVNPETVNKAVDENGEPRIFESSKPLDPSPKHPKNIQDSDSPGNLKSSESASGQRNGRPSWLTSDFEARIVGDSEARRITKSEAEAALRDIEVAGGGETGSFQFVNRDELGARQSAGMDAAERLAALFGRRVVVFRNGEKPWINGITNTRHPDKIFINADSWRPYWSVAGHELWHHLQMERPELADLTWNALRDGLHNFDKYEQMRKADGYSERDIPNELLGDALADAMGDPGFWSRLSQRNPSLFTKFTQAVKVWLDRVVRALRRQGFGAESFFKDFEAAKAVLAEAMARFGAKDANDKLGPYLPDDPNQNHYSGGGESSQTGPSPSSFPTSRESKSLEQNSILNSGVLPYAYENGTDSLQKAHDRLGGPQGLLRSAAQVLGESARYDEGKNSPQSSDDEIRSLKHFARNAGLLMDAHKVRGYFSENGMRGGAEHKVADALPAMRVIKDLDAHALATESVYDYLTDHVLSNYFFGDDIRLEGFYEMEGRFHILTSQPLRDGPHPTLEVMKEKLEQQGLESESPTGSMGTFLIHDEKAGEISVIDVKPDNVIQDDVTGVLWPVDVHFYFDSQKERVDAMKKLSLLP